MISQTECYYPKHPMVPGIPGGYSWSSAIAPCDGECVARILMVKRATPLLARQVFAKQHIRAAWQAGRVAVAFVWHPRENGAPFSV